MGSPFKHEGDACISRPPAPEAVDRSVAPQADFLKSFQDPQGLLTPLQMCFGNSLEWYLTVFYESEQRSFESFEHLPSEQRGFESLEPLLLEIKKASA